MTSQKVAKHMHHHIRCMRGTAFLQQMLQRRLLVSKVVLLALHHDQHTAPVHGHADKTQNQHGLQSQ